MRLPRIHVLAGVNGAGKSSVMGRWIRLRGENYFNPDEAARTIRAEFGCTVDEANARAWAEGKERLENAIATRTDYAFETTLGGNTIPLLLAKAANLGFDVRVWFVGLSSVEQHLARVRARVAEGGHDIPEHKIRERWESSRLNLVLLLPHLTELRIFDNSAERDPVTGLNPPPRLVMHWKNDTIVAPSLREIEKTPEWAKPIVASALQALTPRN